MPARPSPSHLAPSHLAPSQLSIDDLGIVLTEAEQLIDATFVVVDLETTGGSAHDDRITEIGAVKVCGGTVLGEFQTLVDPQTGVPPHIQVLTGITESMLISAPRLGSVLPAFLEFAALDRGSVLVAHNARFDVGFLRAAASRLDLSWPKPRVLDTVPLARRALSRDEVPNCRLSTLAAYLGAQTTPIHRALDDARATVDVLHALLERLGNLGVHTVDELINLTREVTPAQRRKRSLADHLPTGPGVYVFRDGQGAPLYVGTSTNVRRRVRGYFTASEPRARMREMVALTERVDAVECAHETDAAVRENRMISALRPRYNRRSKNTSSAVWVRLTDELYPRLSIVTTPPASADVLGPFPSRRAAQETVDAIHDATTIRRCTMRISARTQASACALAELGRCAAPCEQRISPADYAAGLAPLRTAIGGSPSDLIRPLLERITGYSTEQRYEQAQLVRDRAAALIRALIRAQRLTMLQRAARVVLAAPGPGAGWDVSVIRHGRLASAVRADRSSSVLPLVNALLGAEQSFDDDPAGGADTRYEETEILAALLERPGTRLVELDGVLASPVGAAASWRPWLRSFAAQRSRGASTARPLARPQDIPLRAGARSRQRTPIR